ncbi:hypothetical protein BUALT_Bualt09G0008000 [Buddleja alternifolia]|uniref:Peroxidase n=1 Tax=Buddleja alternifolia TaxID=168488 RepID=A0AAV6X9T4_9LAMI|nr:hypothetical protein BUALT_Bualt09G0008000 [Buddleja alternifolia]
MKREGFNLVVISLLAALGLSLYVGQMHAAVTMPPEARPLKRHFYKKLNTCDYLEVYVKHQVKLWWDQDKSITGKLLKLLYADCMVNAGAPSYPVFLGRRDGFDSNAAWVDLPSPGISIQQGLAYFQSKGLDQQDYATLLGAHTLGKAHCAYIRDRLYNFRNSGKPDPSMSKASLDKLRKQCPQTLRKGQKDPTVFLTDKNRERYRFTNTYYSNVLSHDSVLGVDQQLLNNYNTTQLVLEYAGSFENLKKGFALSISRMGSRKVLTGEQGEIRQNCRLTNKNNPKIK